MSKETKPETAAPIPGDTETSRTIIVRVAAATHKALRIRVAHDDTSIQQWVEELIERELGVREAPPKPATASGKAPKT
jgi:predicted HicB family RNase H-like nuclease